MSDLLIRLQDARRQPLDDIADVIVTDHGTGATVGARKAFKASKLVRVPNVAPLRVYVVRAFPLRHRPVSQFLLAPPSGTRKVELPCPVDPERVQSVQFPPYASLPEKARQLLEASALEHPPQDVNGQTLYDTHELGDVPKAGLLNLLSKMADTRLTDASTVLDHVQSLYRIRGDRVFANVALGLRDLIKTGVDERRFTREDGSLHTPPPGFKLADSFKTDDRYGNLQVTFFSSLTALEFKADIDIDDAKGIAHVFQVLSHWVTGEGTHPYDIHQILNYHQGLDPGYRLTT